MTNLFCWAVMMARSTSTAVSAPPPPLNFTTPIKTTRTKSSKYSMNMIMPYTLSLGPSTPHGSSPLSPIKPFSSSTQSPFKKNTPFYYEIIHIYIFLYFIIKKTFIYIYLLYITIYIHQLLFIIITN